MPFFAIALCLAAAPVATIGIMVLIGFVAPLPGLTAVVITLCSTVAFSLVWARDLDLLTAAVREIETNEAAGGSSENLGPTLMEPLGLEIARLGRRLAARAARIEQERRADTLIIDRLPDALVVMRQDRTVSRQNPAAGAIFGTDLPAVLRHPELRAALDQAVVQRETKSAALTIAAPIARELRATVLPINPPLADGGSAVVVLSDRTLGVSYRATGPVRCSSSSMRLATGWSGQRRSTSENSRVASATRPWRANASARLL
jgi:two-component system phosphate regulon sensor histidine kinase PhoR